MSKKKIVFGYRFFFIKFTNTPSKIMINVKNVMALENEKLIQSSHLIIHTGWFIKTELDYG